MADRMLQRVDRLVVDHDAMRGIVVATLHHIQCGFQLRHRRVAHAHDLGDKTVLLLVVAFDDMVVEVLVHRDLDSWQW